MRTLMTAMVLAVYSCATQAAHSDSAATAPVSSTDTADMQGTCILIAKGNSGLEYNVAAAIKEHFENRGCSVETAELKTAPKRAVSSYKAILLFNSVKKSRLTAPGRRILEQSQRAEEDSRPVVFISTVAGRRWEGKKTKVDAVSGASDRNSAEQIAQRLIDQLDVILADTVNVTDELDQ